MDGIVSFVIGRAEKVGTAVVPQKVTEDLLPVVKNSMMQCILATVILDTRIGTSFQQLFCRRYIAGNDGCVQSCIPITVLSIQFCSLLKKIGD